MLKISRAVALLALIAALQCTPRPRGLDRTCPELPSGRGTLKISINLNDEYERVRRDEFLLHSLDSTRMYNCRMAVRRDGIVCDGQIHLPFVGLDTTLRYTLIAYTGEVHTPETLFADKPYGKWGDTDTIAPMHEPLVPDTTSKADEIDIGPESDR